MTLCGKKVAVLGLGVSGLALARLALRKKALVYAIDQGPPREWKNYDTIRELLPAKQLLAQDDPAAASLLTGGDNVLLVKSPGISWGNPLLAEAQKAGVRIVGEIELASAFVDVPILAVTGTNGKTTTVRMLQEVFAEASLAAFVGGNLGTPLADFVCSEESASVVVLELSSFQLETVDRLRPQVAAILNIGPAHGERYGRLEEYARAKFQIAKNLGTTDLLLLPEELPCEEFLTFPPRSRRVGPDLLADCSLEKFLLPGEHNRHNLAYCRAMVREFGRRHGMLERLERGFLRMLENFRSQAHRLELVGSRSGWHIYNDSKSTNWNSTLAAVQALGASPKPLVLVVGGQARGRGDFPEAGLFERIKAGVDQFICFGEVGKKLARRFHCPFGESLQAVWQLSPRKGTLLFSPAFPSFDQFASYQERGEAFKRLFT